MRELPARPPSSGGVYGTPRGQARREAEMEQFAQRPVADRIRALRRTIVSSGATILMLAMINLLTTPHFPWFLFPAVGMGARVARLWGTLWADGVSARDIFRAPPREPVRLDTDAPPATGDRTLEKVAPIDVQRGPWGAHLRRASEDRRSIVATYEALAPVDRELIPDVRPATSLLLERVAALVGALHRIDAEVPSSALNDVARRIDDAERAPTDAPDRERRLTLLKRQETTVRDLLARRATLTEQLESATLTLQNIRLDMVKLRAAGVQSSIDDASGATQEARALSREIGNALDVAERMRDL